MFNVSLALNKMLPREELEFSEEEKNDDLNETVKSFGGL